MLSSIVHQSLQLYPVQVILCSALFWLFYKWVVESGHQFSLSRGFLLFALAASAIIPLLSIPVYAPAPIPIIAPADYQATPLSDIFTEGAIEAKNNLIFLLFFVYITVCCFLTVRLCIRLFSLYKIFRSGDKKQEAGCLVVYSSKVETPFSFAQAIYLPKLLCSSEEALFILHEHAHLKSRHSLDVLFHEIISIIFWFNPIFKLIGHELKKIHEYQADRLAVSEAPNARIYHTLIAKEFLGFSPKIAHSFHSSITKKRIIMLTKPFHTKFATLRVTLAIPFIFLNLVLFSFTSRPAPLYVAPQEAPTDILYTPYNEQAMIQDTTKAEVRFEVVEVKPMFQGGDESIFAKWVGTQIVYPTAAKEKGVQGRVMMTFIVDTEGFVRDVSVLRSVDPELDAEALRVVASSPKWTPGIQKGNLVRVRYNMPIIFALSPNGGTSGNSSTAPSQEQMQQQIVMLQQRLLSLQQQLLQLIPTSGQGEYRFEVVEEKPMFQGGDENVFSKWVGEQIVYPTAAKEKGIQGRIMLTFVVDSDGNVRDVAVLRGVDPELDKEAVRVVASSPKWFPGIQKGERVNVRYNFPVIFMLR